MRPQPGCFQQELLTSWYQFDNGRLEPFFPDEKFAKSNDHIWAHAVLADNTFGGFSILTIPLDPTSTVAKGSRFFWNDLHVKIEGGRCNLDWLLEDGDKRLKVDPAQSSWLRLLQGTRHVDDTPGSETIGRALDASGNLALFWGLVALSVGREKHADLPELVNARRWTRPVC